MSWGGGFADALQGVRDSQQRRALFELDQRARQAFGQSVQDPNLFQGAVPGAGPMPGSPDMQAYGGGTSMPPPDMSVPRGIRNNNPGNITDSPWTRRQPGYAGTDGRFARFENRGAGDQAVQSLLQNYATQGINTVGGIISKWAPPNENATQDYINFVSKAAGVPPDAPLSPDQRLKVAQAITQFENGIKASAPPPGGMQGPTPGATGATGPMTPPQPGQAPGLFDQRQPAGMMSQPGVGPDPSRFGGGSPPPAGQGGASDGSPPGAPPTGQGVPMSGGAPTGMQAGGLDMSKIVAAVQRANPNAPPEVIGEVVKRFLPILTGERAQGNADRTFGADRSDERFRQADSNRRFAAGRADRAFEESQPMAVQPGVDYINRKTGETVASGRDKPTAANGGKLDAGTMKAIRDAESSVITGQQVIKDLDRALDLNRTALTGPIAGPAGYVRAQFGDRRGRATEELSSTVTNQALSNLKLVFGGNPTEGERKVMLDVSGSVNKDPATRKAIYERAKQVAQSRIDFYKQQAEEMRGGTYYKPGGGAAPAGGGTGAQVIDGVTIRRVQ